MALVDEIKDQGSLEAWLKTQPREVAVDIAHRAAMRVLPIYWEAVLRWQKPESRAIPILRANLVVGAARFVPTPVIRTTAEAAHSAALAATTPTAATATAQDCPWGAAYAAAYDLTSERSQRALAACRRHCGVRKLRATLFWKVLCGMMRVKLDVKNGIQMKGRCHFGIFWLQYRSKNPYCRALARS